MSNSGKYSIIAAGVLSAVMLAATGLLAQVPDDIPAGMEKRRVAGITLVVPRGAKITERDGLVLVEPLETYVARSLGYGRSSRRFCGQGCGITGSGEDAAG